MTKQIATPTLVGTGTDLSVHDMTWEYDHETETLYLVTPYGTDYSCPRKIIETVECRGWHDDIDGMCYLTDGNERIPQQVMDVARLAR